MILLPLEKAKYIVRLLTGDLRKETEKLIEMSYNNIVDVEILENPVGFSPGWYIQFRGANLSNWQTGLIIKLEKEDIENLLKCIGDNNQIRRE